MEGLKVQSIIGVKGAANLETSEIAKGYLMGSVVMVVAGFVFLAAAIMFLIRTIALIFLMILSPLAFAAFALPGTRGYANKWWSSLISNAFFAPAFLFLIYIVSAIISTGGLLIIPGATKGTLSGLATKPDADDLGLLYVYLLILGLIIGALVIAKQMVGGIASFATKESGRVIGAGIRVGGFTGRQTVGRYATSRANALEQKIAASGGAASVGDRMALKTMRGVGNSSFDLGATRGFKAVEKASGVGFGKARTGMEIAKERKEKAKDKKDIQASAKISANNVQLKNIPNAAAAAPIISQLSPKDVSKLEPSTLANPAVAHHFDIATLKAMMDNKDLNLSNSQRATIRTAATAGPNGLAVSNWLVNGGGVGF